MCISHAKTEALGEVSIRCSGELASPRNLPPAVLGASGGEVAGGSVGAYVEFLMPGSRGGTASGPWIRVVDSVEEMFLEPNQARQQVASWSQMFTSEKGAMQLIFPLYDQDGGLDEQWLL